MWRGKVWRQLIRRTLRPLDTASNTKDKEMIREILMEVRRPCVLIETAMHAGRQMRGCCACASNQNRSSCLCICFAYE